MRTLVIFAALAFAPLAAHYDPGGPARASANAATLMSGPSSLEYIEAHAIRIDAHRINRPETEPDMGESLPYSYYVFFEPGSAELSQEGRKVLESAAREIRDLELTAVTIAGEPPAEWRLTGEELMLRRARATTVWSELSNLGVPKRWIARSPQEDGV